jgi:AraC family transcriptional regulator
VLNGSEIVLDVSKVTPGHSFYGLEIPVHALSGARCLRIVHPAGQRIPEHRHEWPLLTIPVLGGYDEECDRGVTSVGGPAAVLHPPGRCHANCIHSSGMETLSIEFDPHWLGAEPNSIDRSYYWIGGRVSRAARSICRLWSDPATPETSLRAATAAFLSLGLKHVESPAPHWLGKAQQQLSLANNVTAADIGRSLGLHPGWASQAYRMVAGEGFQETVRRRRLEKAVQMLRATDEPIAEVAVDCGFCDQSHLNRVMRSVTGRTPVVIRAERAPLAALAAAQACSGDRAPSPS